MRLIDADKLDWWYKGRQIRHVIDNAPTVDAVPLSDLLELRDWLYEHDAITMEGLAQLNQLIARNKKEVEEANGI